MSHYAGYGFDREPFANSPDPGFLLDTRQHATCLQELEISLRLRRGLNLVTGDIGTGKTTLCRSLLRAFAEDAATDVHLLLDPHFASSEEFVRVILAGVSGQSPEPGMGLWALKEALKQQLFRLGLVEKRLVILVIDEGQKISPENLEILREMLNYETNTSKLLQIVIFAQRELEPVIDAMPNLADRINVRRRLTPLSLAETRRMIEHRLIVASGGAEPLVRFNLPAALAIHWASGGSPRKTVRLCHMSLLEMLVCSQAAPGRARVRLSHVRAALRAGAPGMNRRRKAGLAACAAIAVVFGGLWMSLGNSGPVLGTGSVSAAPAMAPVAAAQAEVQPGAGLTAEGLSLAPAAAATQEAQDAETSTARVSLLPQRDHGPAVREAVEMPRPAPLQVDLPEQEAVPARAVLAPTDQAAAGMDKARRLAQKAPHTLDRQ
ncbi:MAG TPA: AAA family ATPase [Humidesulfovibrio sp.]|uniref:ExeA family protein n=1 Tax=Humidesulfovibrio sp. TaxID=2910988 RepID=UPI002BC8796F|nr:AAA family ATPase [Humidesulfovibrio sp.]HWR04925.1 AAA family ATPase [Humidesulfovibrio sp.]